MQELKQQLSKQGLRLTKQRQAVVGVLSHQPQSVETIRQALANQGMALNKTTIYRNLHSLVALGLVHTTQFQSEITLYELADQEHHHHILCEGCGQVEDIHLDETILLQAANQASAYQITRHHLEFFGLCQNCR